MPPPSTENAGVMAMQNRRDMAHIVTARSTVLAQFGGSLSVCCFTVIPAKAGIQSANLSGILNSCKKARLGHGSPPSRG